MPEFETVIGLEVHVQLSTNTKAFCGCKNEFGQKPNTSVCPVCLGLPGSLPVLNEKFLEYAIRVSLALKCDVAFSTKFDRKNYFYPDLPKNFQISQYDMPIGENGFLDIIEKGDSKKRIRIKRVHMEEDAGKLIHNEKKSSYVDYNRCGTPLLEIVTQPDINSPQEAYVYLTELKNILKYLEVSDCDMEKGILRCDANISVREKGQKKLGTKVELKNMNSFKNVKLALGYEEKRQVCMLKNKELITQQTMLWDADSKTTRPMRTKEEAHDYRYFPEPDLTTFSVARESVEKIKADIPELPDEKKKRFISEYAISDDEADLLVSDKAMSEYFDECVKKYPNAKTIINWITSDVLKYINSKNMQFKNLNLSSENFIEMLKMIDDNKINGKIAKTILVDMIDSGKTANELVLKKGLTQISNEDDLKEIITNVIKNNFHAVNDYKNGKTNALGFLIGQVMKASKGKANPEIVNRMLEQEIKK